MGGNQWKYGALNFLGFVPGVLRVSPPGGFDKCDGSPDFRRASTPLQHTVKAVCISINIFPSNSFPRPGGSLSRLIQVKFMLFGKVFEKRDNTGFQDFTEFLSPTVS